MAKRAPDTMRRRPADLVGSVLSALRRDFLVNRYAPAIDRSSFRQNARARAVARLVRVRLYVAPFLATLALVFAFFEPTAWRRAVLFPAVATMFVLSYVEWVRVRSRGVQVLSMPLNLCTMVVGQIALAFATGGLLSPVVTAMVLVAIASAVFVEAPLVYLLVEGLQVPALWGMALVHTSSWPVDTLVPQLLGEASSLEHGPAPWIFASIYTVLLNAAVRLGGQLRDLFSELFDDAIAERDRALSMHAEQARALTALSAELAHELKNPLASVKGLATLIARDAQGKAKDRLTVLRGEVDRMQGILDELLDFSRPLVPLCMEDVDLAQLARDVSRLYEATAADNAVELQLSAAAPVQLRCDPRKVRQILINLMQNAIDASPAGSRVELDICARAGLAHLSVADRGAGLDPSVADRLFEPGMTTKEQGSGLGLVIARSLARQHGGELSLRPRSGGGAVAELSLPLEPAQPAQPMLDTAAAEPAEAVPASHPLSEAP